MNTLPPPTPALLALPASTSQCRRTPLREPAPAQAVCLKKTKRERERERERKSKRKRESNLLVLLSPCFYFGVLLLLRGFESNLLVLQSPCFYFVVLLLLRGLAPLREPHTALTRLKKIPGDIGTADILKSQCPRTFTPQKSTCRVLSKTSALRHR